MGLVDLIEFEVVGYERRWVKEAAAYSIGSAPNTSAPAPSFAEG